MTRAGPSTHMVVFGIEDGSGSPVDRFERGDSQRVSLLSICRALISTQKVLF